MTGAPDENVFKCGFADRNGLNLSRKSLSQISHKLVAIAALHADFVIEHLSFGLKALFYARCQRLRLLCFQQDDVSADLAAQLRGCSQGDNLPGTENNQAVASFCFFHEMSSNNNGDALLIAQLLKIQPQVAAGAGVEARSRLIE